MKLLRLLVLALFTTVPAVAAAADEKDNKKLLIGTWEVSKADEGTIPAGATIEFNKDGKFKMTAKKGGKDETREGTWAVDGKAISVTTKRDDGDRTTRITIKTISAAEMTLEGPDGKSVTFKKK